MKQVFSAKLCEYYKMRREVFLHAAKNGNAGSDSGLSRSVSIPARRTAYWSKQRWRQSPSMSASARVSEPRNVSPPHAGGARGWEGRRNSASGNWLGRDIAFMKSRKASRPSRRALGLRPGRLHDRCVESHRTNRPEKAPQRYRSHVRSRTGWSRGTHSPDRPEEGMNLVE